ncbi:MAG: hypothetical protein ACWGHH_06450 [Sulfurovaceae bacterium]
MANNFIITTQGQQAIANALANGTTISPHTFKFITPILPINEAYTENSISPTDIWYSNTITEYDIDENATTSFNCIVEANLATAKTGTVGLYLDNGMLFAICALSSQLPEGQRQGVYLRINNDSATSAFNFNFLSLNDYMHETDSIFIGTTAIALNRASGALTLNGVTAEKAIQLAVARIIELTGGVIGSAAFDGSGNVTIQVALANSGATAGTYKSVTINEKGMVISGTNPTTLSGYGITDVYTKTETDSLLQGLKAKNSVKVATTANITLSGTQTIDGVSVAAGDRVLVKNQTTGSQNGIYVVSASAWSRAADADTALELTSAYVLAEQGTVNANIGFVQTIDNITLNTTSLTFAKFSTFGGNADTATALQTARTINGVSFDGTANINIEDRIGTSIASASTTTIGTVGLGETIHITGITTITSFGTANTGVRRTLIFDGILTLTHNATTLILPTGTNITTAVGDTAEFVKDDGGWRCVDYTRKDGKALSEVTFASQAEVDAGMVTNKAVSPATLASKTSGMFVLQDTVLHITV